MQYLVKRIFLAIITMAVILGASYTLMRLAPGDPTKSQMLGEGAADKGMDGEKGLAKNLAIREKLHLDQPIYIGLGYWFKGLLLHGELGESAAVDKGRPVGDLILTRLPVTLRISFLAVLLTYLLAVPIGIFSAVKPDTIADRIITFGLFLLYSLPIFWVALMLQATICQGGWLPIFPLKGLSTPDVTGLTSWQVAGDISLRYVLPVICLSYAGFAGISRYMRAGMIEVIHQDYIRTARAKGASETVVIFRHALRNALIIMVTLFAGLLPGLVSGSIIVEYVFSIPGMGELSMMALTSRDYPLLMALFGFGGALTLLGILLSDLLYVAVDPRITFESKK